MKAADASESGLIVTDEIAAAQPEADQHNMTTSRMFLVSTC